jgi:hypothetical protein
MRHAPGSNEVRHDALEVCDVLGTVIEPVIHVRARRELDRRDGRRYPEPGAPDAVTGPFDGRAVLHVVGAQRREPTRFLDGESGLVVRHHGAALSKCGYR